MPARYMTMTFVSQCRASGLFKVNLDYLLTNLREHTKLRIGPLMGVRYTGMTSTHVITGGRPVHYQRNSSTSFCR
jgi:hypothetical protein